MLKFTITPPTELLYKELIKFLKFYKPNRKITLSSKYRNGCVEIEFPQGTNISVVEELRIKLIKFYG